MKNASILQIILFLSLLMVRATLLSTVDNDQPKDIMREPDCSDIAAYSFGSSVPQSGKYHLIVGEGRRGVWAYCDMETDGGGWTLSGATTRLWGRNAICGKNWVSSENGSNFTTERVIQRRTGAAVSFYRNWNDYHKGFGDPEGDYWLGNTYLHSMTVNKRYVLRIDLTDWDNKTYYAAYDNFVVGGSESKYKLLSVGEFNGDCGDSLAYHVAMKFSTFDQDNDVHSDKCAQMCHGAWWYGACHHSNLNGLYKIGGAHSSDRHTIIWGTGKGDHYSYKKVEMKIRPYKY